MINENDWKETLYHEGASATLVYYAGETDCPCKTHRDSSRPAMTSREYHDLYPAATNCNGTGKIGGTRTSVSIKSFIGPISLLSFKSLKFPIKLNDPGLIDMDADFLMSGALNVATSAFVDLAAVKSPTTTVTWDGKTFKIKHVFDVPVTTNVFDLALLKEQ